MGNFLGEVRPQWGRWIWPLSQMEEGDWFLVDNALRNPEAVRNYVSVQAARLGKRFAVEKKPLEHPGFCRVTCGGRPEAPRREQVDYQSIMAVLKRYYPTAKIDNLKWTGLDMGECEERKAQCVEAPEYRDFVAVIPNDWTFTVELRDDGFAIERVEQGTTLSSWRVKRLQEVMG